VNNPGDKALIQASDVRKTFYDSGKEIPVLKGASMTMEAGSNTSISGQSGCGKSTLLNLLCGLDKLDEGTIQWNGSSLKNMRLNEVSTMRGRFFGFIFQSYYLISELNAIENVLMAARLVSGISRETKNRASELLETVGLGHRIKHPVQKLSGGERQRVAIARALVNNPKVVLADEPTGNLDESTAQSTMDLILNVCEKNSSALLLVTHNPEFARLTHKQYVLHDGLLTKTS
jgi:lipoprotein-releasing system ATP-binding protein